ncbi:MAG: pyridine nucleotide-disulfide oxidoreductase [Gammaproteobacteria bacterium]|nr:MAG: pyridine nucleotide-disulfide oxidoreductase [Gammaproteobacteria bacterium]
MNITILGSGFAALTAIEQVRRSARKANIRVIAPSKRFIYYPSLIWLPSGLKTREDITWDLQHFFQKYKVEFVQAKVITIEDEGRLVKTDIGDFSNDGLIIATGCRFQNHLPGVENVQIACRFDTADRLKKRLQTLASGTIAVGFDVNPDEPTAMRGPGPVLEYVLGIDTLLRKQRRRRKFNLVFFSPESDLIREFGDKGHQRILKLLKKRRIKVIFGQLIKGFEDNKVLLDDSVINADLTLFQPGMTGAGWLDNTGLPRSPAGLVQADEHTQVAGWSKTYVVGDAGSYPGPDWQPKLGVNAVIQAKVAAVNVINDIKKPKRAKQSITVKMIYIIDMLNRGMLVKRSEKGIKILPALRIFHRLKILVEKKHLKKFG